MDAFRDCMAAALELVKPESGPLAACKVKGDINACRVKR
jgi:hypothetical protein